MSKTGKKRCEICGQSPAYYSKRTRRVLCMEHAVPLLLKIIIGGAISAGIGLIIFML